MKQIEERWIGYASTLKGVDEDSIQYKETKKAFYAGCLEMFELAIKLTEIPEDKAEYSLQKIEDELLAFCQSHIAAKNRN